MKVFISWSGDKSRLVALALREWLPQVINIVEPFVSSKDIYAGAHWQLEVAEQLQETRFGIVCVTKDNQTSPWLNFEAGALAKAVQTSFVVPLAVDLKTTDIAPPLGQYQAQPADKEGIAKLLVSVNAATERPLPDDRLEKSTETWWPQLDATLKDIETESDQSGDAALERSDRDLLEEVLNAVRALGRATVNPAALDRVPPDHPFIAELRALLAKHDPEVTIWPARNRMLGIGTAHDLPDDLQNEIRKRADTYNIRVGFLTRGTGFLSRLMDPVRLNASVAMEGVNDLLVENAVAGGDAEVPAGKGDTPTV